MKLPRTHFVIAPAIAAAVLAAAPLVAHACSQVFAPPPALHISQSDLRFTSAQESARVTWGVGRSWVSARPFLDQRVRLEGWQPTRFVTAAYRQQRALTVGARWFESGAMATDDNDPNTPACAIAGERTWSAPKFLVRETSTAISIIAISRETPGSREGCMFVTNSCGDFRSITFRLAAPVGDRKIFRSHFA